MADVSVHKLSGTREALDAAAGAGGSASDVLTAIEEQARRAPDAPAVIDSTGELTYSELLAEVDHLARVLTDSGTRPGDLVGLCLPRGRVAVTAMLAALRAGVGYLPLDPEYPKARLALILEEARPHVVLVREEDQPALPPGAPVLRPGRPGGLLGPGAQAATAPEDPAYVIFTSGSTGRPKGVEVSRRALAHFSRAARERYGITSDDRVLQFASLSFDASIEEIFPPLTAGAAVVIRDEEMISRPDLFLDRCAALGITVLDLPTAYWHELVRALDAEEAVVPPSVRMVIIGGEAVAAAAVSRWQIRVGSGVKLLNTYGPTETTVVATAADLTEWSGSDPVPIGFPMRDVVCRVVAEGGGEAATGEAGELYVGGMGVATGYLERPELTAERFAARAGHTTPEYRTGDRVRRLPDGALEYLGRMDQQVKIRGFRVEPVEIETALRGLHGVTDAVVLVDDRAGQPKLVAHLLSEGSELDTSEVRRRLSEQLPLYLVPAVFTTHTSFPLTVQGKVDRAALAAMRPVGQVTEPQDSGSGLESGIGAMWRELLGISVIRPEDDFFALGGDSLTAIRMISRLRQQHGTELTLSRLYSAPSLADVTAAVREAGHGPHECADEARTTAPETDYPRVLALTPLQRDFWMAEQVCSARPVHTLGIRYRWTGQVQPGLLAAGLAELVARHPALGARIPLEDDEPVMRISPRGTVPVTQIDLRGLDPEERESRAAQARMEIAHEKLDLTTGPLARVVLLRTGGDDELLLAVHHLVFDGWSVGVFGDELASICTSLADGRGPAAGTPDRLPELVRRQSAHADRDSLAAYWRDRFAGADFSVELPTDKSRPPVPTFAAGRVSRTLGPDVLERLRGCGRTHQASLFMVVLAGVQAVLSRYTGREDITVLAPVAGRDDTRFESVIGAALNILPLRGDVSGEPTFSELISRVRESVIRDLEHQSLSLPDITAAIGQSASGLRRLSGVTLTVHNTPPGMSLVRYAGEEPPAATMVDLAFGLDFPEDGPVLAIDYATDLFDAERAEALLDHLLVLLDAGTEEPATVVGRLPLLTAAEQDRILHTWNDGEAETGSPRARSLQQLFERWAAERPAAPALTSGPRTVSYGELNARANRIAGLLRRRGVGPGSRVAICLDRGTDLFEAMWAVLKAGAAYVPLDPAYPVERLRYMLEDSSPAALVTRQDLPGVLEKLLSYPVSDQCVGRGAFGSKAEVPHPTRPEEGMTTVSEAPGGTVLVLLDAEAALIAEEDAQNPRPVGTPDDPAYVIYTSGSTGRPKGVVVTHDNLVHAVDMWQRAYNLRPEWTYQQAASFSFDMFVGETLRALCTGGRLVVVPREVLLDPGALYTLMRTEQVRCTELVPVVLRALLAHVATAGERLDFVRLLIGGGEKWQVREYQEARRLVGPGNRVVNAYGVTEVTVDNVYFDGAVDELPADAPLPIGRPFPHNRAYVLDAYRRPVPPGVVGELYLGGAGVSPGYHGRPELTADRFVPDPYARSGEAMMYRTGDGARFRSDGTIDFLGRLDDQVKVNGYRIELGEVEAVLGALPGALASAAAVHQLPSGTAQLVGYLVARPDVVLTEAGVRGALSAGLPVHMIPSRVVVLPRLPLTPNGKLDRRALPAPPDAGAESARTGPRTPTEHRIAEIWARTLSPDPVQGASADEWHFGIDDSFFSLGGDSFTALRIVRQIDPALALVELYQRPTVRGLADLLDRRGTEAPKAHSRLLHRLTSTDADTAAGGVTVVTVPFSGGSAVSYQPLADQLPGHWGLYSVELPGHDLSRPEDPLLSAAAVADRVVAELRSLEGPVLLYGHCLGTAVTLEVARRAEAAEVELVGVGLGASFPTARMPGKFFDWFHRLVPTDRFTSNREYLSYLRSRGGFTDLESPEHEEFVLRNVRHDARDAEEYFTAAYRSEETSRLRAPVLSVVGSRDRVTELYQERYHEWEHFAHDVGIEVLPKAGHFFVKTHAEPLSRILVERVAHWQGSEATRVEDIPAAAPEISSVPTDPMPEVSSRQVEPRLSRFAVVAIGQFLSMIGSSLSTLVLSIWVYQRSGSITDFALVNAVGMLPGIVVGPVAGAVADRWDRRRTMLTSDAAAALAMVSLALLVHHGGLEMWQVYLAVSVTSTAGGFQRPAYLAAVAQLVPKRYLGHANGISQLGVGVGTVFGPMMGAGLIGVIGISGVILIDVLSFVAGVVTLLLIRFPDTLFRRRDENFRKEITGGWHYIRRRPGLLTALRFFVIDHAFYTLGFAVITPMLLIEYRPVILGAALAAGGLGGLGGSLLMGLWGGTTRRASGMIIFMGVASLAMSVVGIGLSPYLVIVGMFALALGESVADGHWIALIQTKVGLELQGRVLALFMTLMMLTMPLGYLVVGPLAEHYVQPLLESGGLLAGTVGEVIGTGPGRGLALLVFVSGLLQLAWAVRGWYDRRLRLLEDGLPDAIPPAELGDLDELQRDADARLTVSP